MNRKHFLSFAALAVATLVAGCKDEPANGATAGAPAAASASVSLSAIEAGAKGFTVGSVMSARTVYVFFDAQCPHCGHLWEAAKPLQSQAKFVWIPVAVLNKASLSQGATLLAAGDPVSAMNTHEASLLARTGGISAASGTEAQSAQVEKNTALLNSFGVSSIPYVVAKHATTGELVTQEGASNTAVLAARLGLTASAI
jgi:thiol:disulfide interchange protein DsbG